MPAISSIIWVSDNQILMKTVLIVRKTSDQRSRFQDFIRWAAYSIRKCKVMQNYWRLEMHDGLPSLVVFTRVRQLTGSKITQMLRARLKYSQIANYSGDSTRNGGRSRAFSNRAVLMATSL